MGQEIERKFLVNHTLWNELIKPIGETYRQGYINIDPQKTIRVRLTETKGFLTIKGITVGATRSEFEYEIPIKDANDLLDVFSISELSKIRYKIKLDDKIWEVDEFLGENIGLIVAEIELYHENENFKIPNWIAEEVTEQEKYYNSSLTVDPYTKWGTKKIK
jgi:adenylate cyclase